MGIRVLQFNLAEKRGDCWKWLTGGGSRCHHLRHQHQAQAFDLKKKTKNLGTHCLRRSPMIRLRPKLFEPLRHTATLLSPLLMPLAVLSLLSTPRHLPDFPTPPPPQPLRRLLPHRSGNSHALCCFHSRIGFCVASDVV